MSEHELGPLPEPDVTWPDRYYGDEHAYSAEAMRAYAAQEVAKERERWAWQPIETAPEGRLVVVGWLDKQDHEFPQREDFDCLEDGCWAKWHDYAEQVEVVGGHGVKYKAPYTHWMELPPLATQQQESTP